MKDRWIILTALAIQALCAAFFISDIMSSLIGFRSTPISWLARETIEIGAAVGLAIGFALGAVALHRSTARRKQAEEKFRVASAAFMDHLDESFEEWGLTPAEIDVALFAIKGLSTREIAEMRQTSEGTIKAQTNAIYRKAGVTGRTQLLSTFIDDLMEEGLKDTPLRDQAGAA